MNSIMISIKAKWIAKILNQEKTIEVRKTAPKDWIDYLSGKTDKKPEPKTVYIYCTKEDDLLRLSRADRDRFVIGKNFDLHDYYRLHSAYNGKGGVVAKFILTEVEDASRMNSSDGFRFTNEACISYDEFLRYLYKGREQIFGWHISDLVIFDRPKELGDLGLTKAPQSWCYCEEIYPGATMRKIELPKEVDAKPYKKEK